MKSKSPEYVVKYVTWIGALINIFLSSAKLVVGFMFKSQTLIADGVHSLSDLVSDAAVLVGVRFWSARPDEKHPYGHGRIETLVTVFIGVLLFAVACLIAVDAFSKLNEVKEAPSWLAAAIALISIISKEALYRWTVFHSKRIGSSALYANAWHHRSDAMSSVPAFIAIVLAMLKPEWHMVDSIGAIVVAAMLAVTALKIVIPAFSQLVDGGSSVQLCENISKLALEVPGVEDAHAVRTRYFGNNIFVDLHIEVDADMNVKDAHDISEQVQEILVSKGPNIVDVVVHIEPYIKDK